METTLMFNILSADKPPGSGIMEFITSNDKEKKLYKELSNITDWRKKLSNEYPLTLNIDNFEWLSVEHFCFYSRMKQNNLVEKLSEDWQKDKISTLKTKYKISTSDYSVSDLEKALRLKFAIPEFKHILCCTKNARLTTWKRGQDVQIVNQADKEIKIAHECQFTNLLIDIRDSIPPSQCVNDSSLADSKTKRKTKKNQQPTPVVKQSDKNTRDIVSTEQEKQNKIQENVPNHFEINISSDSQNLKILSKKDFQSSSELDSNYDPDKNKSNRALTIYEKTNIIGTRMEQLALGSESFLSPKEQRQLNCVKKIARLEFDKKLIPFIICRTLPDNTKEYWKLSDMLI